MHGCAPASSPVTRPDSAGSRPRSTPRRRSETPVWPGLAPDVCEWSNEWPSRMRAFFGVLLGSIEGMDWRADLARVSIPRLVVHGELDNTPLAGNCEWVTGHPSVRLALVRGAGHWPHYERPEETLVLIRAFLDGDRPAGREPDACS